MSHLMRCEDVKVGTRLRYQGREYTVTSIGVPGDVVMPGERVATLTPAKGVPKMLSLNLGWSVWAMDSQS